MKTRYTERLNKTIIIGTSAGGINALKPLVRSLSKKFPYPIVVVIHRLKNVRSHLVEVLQTFTKLKVKEAEEKEKMAKGFVYVVPSNYHLMLEENSTFSLTVDELINFSRPSIDVSFISFSEILKERLLCLVLTGANSDGAAGALTVYENDGEVWIQDPEEAYVSTMPAAALEKVPLASKLSLQKMVERLIEFEHDAK